MGKSTINGNFPWQNVSSPEGSDPVPSSYTTWGWFVAPLFQALQWSCGCHVGNPVDRRFFPLHINYALIDYIITMCIHIYIYIYIQYLI